jgi:hypothetical protein
MPRTLRILGLAVALFFLICLLNREGRPFSMEATINPNGESVLVCTPSTAGQYFLYLHYDTESVPNKVKEDFLDWKHPPRANWDAILNVSTNRALFVSKRPLELGRLIQSGRDFYFLIGQCKLRRHERLNSIGQVGVGPGQLFGVQIYGYFNNDIERPCSRFLPCFY